mgnify:CR=1 FL=1
MDEQDYEEYSDEEQVDPDYETVAGTVALIQAAGAGRTDVVEDLLARNADPEFENKFGMTPLTKACLAGYADTARALLFDAWGVARANVQYINQHGMTTMDELFARGQSPLGKALLFQPLDHVEIGREIARLAQNGLAARAHFKRSGNQLEQVHTGGIAGNDLMR